MLPPRPTLRKSILERRVNPVMACFLVLFSLTIMEHEQTYERRHCASCTHAGQLCVACHGVGWVMVLQPCHACSQCGGTGRATREQSIWGFRCLTCWGSGWEPAQWGPPFQVLDYCFG